MRKSLCLLGLLGLFLFGIGSALAIGESTGTVAVCATVTAPGTTVGAHTIADNGSALGTIPGVTVPDAVASQCVTSTYTVPTVTVTSTVTSTATTTLSSSCSTVVSPDGSIQAALTAASAGQTVCVRAGTYSENLVWSGSAAVTLEGYPGDTPPVLQPASPDGTGNAYALQVTGSNLTVTGFVIQGGTGTSDADVFFFGGANHDTLSNNEIRNGQDQLVFADNTTSYLTFLRNRIHNAGFGHVTGQHQSHGIYIEGGNDLIANNVLYDFPYGFGLQVYPSNHDTTVAENTITGAAHSAIVLGTGTGLVVRNNVLAYSGSYGVEFAGCPTAAVIDHNLFFSDPGGLFFSDPDGQIQSGCSPDTSGGGNVTADPLFTDYPGRVLSVQAASPAVDTGTLLAVFSPAFDGTARPVGAGPDEGAYER